MKWNFYIITSITCFLFINSTFAQTGNYIVVYKNHKFKDNAVKRKQFKTRHSFNIVPGVAATLDSNELEAIHRDPDVAYVEPDYEIHKLGEVSASGTNNFAALASSQTIPYGISMVNAPAVWPYTKGAGVRVAVLDTGIAMYHPDRGNVVASTSFVSGEAVEDFDGHGTHTSGTIAAADNGIGVVGIAPQADLLIAKVLDNTGSGDTSWLISGIEWAVSNGAKVISMSLGSSSYSSSLDTACTNAFNSGVILVAASGNDGTNIVDYPAGLSSVISVAAVDSTSARASFSNYNSDVELSAPGVGVESTVALDTTAVGNAVWSNISHQANMMQGTAPGSVSGTICNCGLATGTDAQNTCPNSVAGNIAHIRRGTNTFAQKVAHAFAKGAKGVIISNNVSGNFNGTLSDGTSMVAVSISQSDGDQLQTLAQSGIVGTISVDGTLYDYYDGTSMATPHVAGVAALLFAASGTNTSASEIRNILDNSAHDLGTAGRDQYYGYGLVNASAGLSMVVPHNCSAMWVMGQGLTGDLNRDCSVNALDLLAIGDQWLISCDGSNTWCDNADIDQSGSVNVVDFSKMASDWLECNDPQNIDCI